MDKDIDTYLKSRYYNTNSAGSFGGFDKLYKAIQKDENAPQLSKKEVRKWLQGQDPFTTHRHVLKRFKRPRVIVSSKFQQVDSDTASMIGYKKDNRGVGYILIVIDILSRYLYAAPLKRLRGVDVKKGLQFIFKKMGRYPQSMRSDLGSEYKGKDLKTFYKDKNINHFTTRNEVKANYAERVIQTIKSRIERYFDHRQLDHKWIDQLQHFVDSYNHTFHSSIHMTPAEALKTSDCVLFKTQYSPLLSTKPFTIQKFKLKVGDKVRMSMLKSKFEKAYDRNFTTEIFEVNSRKRTDGIPQYTLKDYNENVLEGIFYQPELQKVLVDDNSTYKIEKIIRKRKRGGVKQVLVKWLHWPKKFNSWINENEVQNLENGV